MKNEMLSSTQLNKLYKGVGDGIASQGAVSLSLVGTPGTQYQVWVYVWSDTKALAARAAYPAGAFQRFSFTNRSGSTRPLPGRSKTAKKHPH